MINTITRMWKLVFIIFYSIAIWLSRRFMCVHYLVCDTQVWHSGRAMAIKYGFSSLRVSLRSLTSADDGIPLVRRSLGEVGLIITKPKGNPLVNPTYQIGARLRPRTWSGDQAALRKTPWLTASNGTYHELRMKPYISKIEIKDGSSGQARGRQGERNLKIKIIELTLLIN